jgi:Holliday junction resolvasome RuvABC endonuclease subunit
MSKSKPGFCVVNNEGKILFAISYPGSTKTKALEILIFFKNLIKKFKPKIIVFEDTFTRFKKSASVLSFYQGLVYSECILHDLEVFKISNLAVKKFFESTTKEEIFEVINNLYEIKLDFDEFNDEVDAIALALFSLYHPEKLKKL